MGFRLFCRDRGLFSPLTPDLSKKRVPFTHRENASARTVKNQNTRYQSPFTLYVGENFVVKLPRSLDLTRLVNNVSTNGFITTDFFASKNMQTISLTAGAYRMMSTPNAGGSSLVSEVLSFEMLGRCFGAKLTKTEMEVSYFPYGGSITDYVCEVSQTTVGVSVTRAWKYHGVYELDDATHLLNKKLKGVIQSSRNSLVKWTKQILHVWSASELVTSILNQAYNNLDPEVKANTVVLVTTATKADYIFTNGLIHVTCVLHVQNYTQELSLVGLEAQTLHN